MLKAGLKAAREGEGAAAAEGASGASGESAAAAAAEGASGASGGVRGKVLQTGPPIGTFSKP